jgi:hypothetical protein
MSLIVVTTVIFIGKPILYAKQAAGKKMNGFYRWVISLTKLFGRWNIGC